ncbi:MAG: fructose-6-phosphate aldolase [Methylomicrobium sp.]
MFELYLDTADIKQIARFHACLPIKGVTTNPSILAKSGVGLNRLLLEIAELLGPESRFHVQVVSDTVDGMVDEAKRLQELPYDIVVKIPTTEIGLAAIKLLKADNIAVLATAIYSVQQGVLAMFCGADYLAPYVNRIDALGVNGVDVVADLQGLIERHNRPCTLLPASFKNTRQVIEVLTCGVGAITLPPDIAEQMLIHPAVSEAVERFDNDWRQAFGEKLSYQS